MSIKVNTIFQLDLMCSTWASCVAVLYTHRDEIGKLTLICQWNKPAVQSIWSNSISTCVCSRRTSMHNKGWVRANLRKFVTILGFLGFICIYNLIVYVSLDLALSAHPFVFSFVLILCVFHFWLMFSLLHPQ